ncbi:hypothetical protein AAHA92_33439 [Salvia divinorum]|uniref:F-box protein n=1 Tax=Salvia divinorum TaxID=28513 RepID=A0ABD1FRC6_SALDI
MMLKYMPQSIKYFCFDKVKLKDDTDLDLEELEFQGNCLHKDIPIFAGCVCVGDAMFMVGGSLYSVPTPISHSLPKPYLEMYKRNLIYVGGNILFMIDYSSSWLVYNLSSKKVGNMEVELPNAVVIEAFYVGSTDIKSTSWVFYVFMNRMINYQTCGVRYAKVEVVQGKDGDYIATVQMNGLLRVPPYSEMYIIGFEAKSTRDAKKELLKEKGKEKMMRIE